MMTYRVEVGINTDRPIWRAYVNSYEAFKHPLGHMAGKSFWDAYQAEYNVKLVEGELVFESEAHFTWFMLRWS